MGERTRSASEDLERSENVTIVAETFSGRAPTATVSSLKSEDSTEQLICKTPQKTKPKPKAKAKSSPEKIVGDSLEASLGSGGSNGSGVNAGGGGRRTVVVLGLAQVVVGALLVGAGAVAVVRGAALSRVGAGLWAGAVAVVAGMVGLLAGIGDCHAAPAALAANQRRSPLLTAFLAMSLCCLACGQSVAVLAATGLHRDYARTRPDTVLDRFQDEMEAWNPVLANIALLIIATVHCLISVVSIVHLSKRVCPCLRPRQPFDHNQFDPHSKTSETNNYVVRIDENTKKTLAEKLPCSAVEQKANHELCKRLETKLANGETLEKLKKKTKEGAFGSANSKETLVSSWLGRHQAVLQAPAGQGAGERRTGKVLKVKVKPQPVMLVPAHPASTLGRGRVPMGVVMPPRYATLPLPLPPPQYAPLYYPIHDQRVRRRRGRSPARTQRTRRRGGGGGGGGEVARGTRLTRSLERIHRKRRADRDRDRVSDTELRRTYTGLDRAYAEQFIAVCDESRSHAADRTLHSLASTGSSDGSSDQRDSF